jgi:8-oxo-dGTP diphosphatase
MDKIQAYLDTQPKITAAPVGYLVRSDEVLLGVRKRSSQSIGGKAEPGETNEAALKREILEEVGVTVKSCTLVGQSTCLFPHKPKWNQTVFLYIVTSWEGEPTETDVMQPLWFKRSELPVKRMWPDNVHTVPLVLAGKHVKGTFLYKEDGTLESYNLHETTVQL